MKPLSLYVCALVLSAAAFAEPQPGAPDFSPTPQQPVGWRGDGTGRYPGATPPLEWSRWPKGFADMRCQAKKPADGALASGRLLMGGTLQEWLVLGPFDGTEPTKAIDAPWVEKESDLSPDADQKAGERTWQFLWSRSRAVSLKPDAESLAVSWSDKTDNKPDGFYAHTYVYAKGAAALQLSLDPGKGRVRVYINGTLVEPTKEKEKEKLYPANLSAGWNRILIKVVGHPRISPRLLPAVGTPMESKNILWALKIPEIDTGNNGTSTPIVVGDRLYLNVEPMGVMCVSRADGKILWLRFNDFYDAGTEEQRATSRPVYEAIAPLIADLNKATDAAVSIANTGGDATAALAKVKDAHGKVVSAFKRAGGAYREWGRHDGGMSSPTVCSDGKFIYALYAPGLAVCYDLEGGRKWCRALDRGGAPEHGHTSSPLLIDGKFICLMGGGPVALYAATGNELWRQKHGGGGHGSLLSVRIGQEAYVICPWSSVAVYRVKDGAPAQMPKDRFVDVHNNWTTSVVADGTLWQQDVNDFHATASVIPVRFTAADDGTAKVRPEKRISAPTKLGCPNASPLFDQNLVYLFTRIGRLAVFDAAEKKFVYEQLLEMLPTQGWVSDPGATASPAFAGGHIFLTDDHLATTVIKPGKTFEQERLNYIWSGDYIVSSPVFAGKNIYMRGYDFLYAIGEK